MARMLAVAVALAACAPIPRYERPEAPVPDRFDAATPGGRVAAQIGWRGAFRDPQLVALIERALRSNRDLRVAALQVEEARAQYRIVRADLYPQVAAAGSITLRGTPDDVTGTYQVGGSVAWELDLFGRLRSLKAAALEDYLAVEETRRAAYLTLVAEVATQYLRTRAFAEQRALAEQTLAAVTDALATTQRLFDAGQRSELDVATARSQVAGARAEVARLVRLHQQAANALAELVGEPLRGDLPAAAAFDADVVIADLSPGIPSQVLLRRPDVLAAEHALRSANANIGAARAAFFPSLNLTAFGGLASTALTGLFGGAGLLWTFTPTLTQPLFTGGRNRAALDVAKVRKRIEVARYERVVQTAFREVADALVARAALDAQLAAQTEASAAQQHRFELSTTRYQNGIESYLVVLDAQRELYAAQAQLIQVRLERLTNLVDLYRALGGGWFP